MRPFTRHFIARLAAIDKAKTGVLKMTPVWSLRDAHSNEFENYMKTVYPEMLRIEISNSKLAGYPRDCFGQLNEVKKLYSMSGQRFIDPEFPPTEASLYKKESPSGSPTIDSSTTFKSKFPCVEWKRAPDFLARRSSTNLKVFSDGIEPADIRQGALGDCWFLCSLAAIAEFPKLVTDLFLEKTENVNSCGLYYVQFCKMGLWTPIRIDDFFPCYPGGGPLFARNHGPEMWALLLEKAFAKYCGSYEALTAGKPYQAMMDLTGAPFEHYVFDDVDIAAKIKNGKLWEDLLQFDAAGYLISASTHWKDEIANFMRSGSGKLDKSRPTGLQKNHAYTVLTVKQSKYGPKLLKIRNPWGDTEWAGDWSDCSPLWTKAMQDEIEQIKVEDDGTFWMCFEDLIQYFKGVNVCMVRGVATPPWIEERRRFFYYLDEAGSKVTCHNYRITVSEPGGVFYFSVHQQDERRASAPPYMDIGVSVLEEQHQSANKSDSATEASRKHKLIGGSGIILDRQNQFKISLKPGTYIVAPVSSGCRLKTHATEYSQRKILSDIQASRSQPSNAGGQPKTLFITDAAGAIVDFTEDAYRVFTEIFHRMDDDTDGFLSKDELEVLTVHTEGMSLSTETFLRLVSTFGSKDDSKPEALSLEGFLQGQLYFLKQAAADEGSLLVKLSLLGYDDQLVAPKIRAASLVVHSGSAAFSLQTCHFDPVVHEDAIELVVRKNGDMTTYKSQKVKVYKHRSGYNGTSYLVENTHTSPMVVMCDCSGSTNAISHRGSLIHEEIIPPGGDVVMHHLMPADLDKSFSTNFTFTCVI